MPPSMERWLSQCCGPFGDPRPGSIVQRESADGVPLPFEEINLLFRVRGFGKSLRSYQPPKCSWFGLVVSQSRNPGLDLPPRSVRFVRFVFHPRVRRDPVHFPSLASIIRKCLFKATRIWGDVRDNKSNKNGPAVHCFLVEKLTASIFEFADRGLTQRAAFTIGKIEAPLVGFGIV